MVPYRSTCFLGPVWRTGSIVSLNRLLIRPLLTPLPLQNFSLARGESRRNNYNNRRFIYMCIRMYVYTIESL